MGRIFLEVLMGPQTPKLDGSYIERRMDDRMKDAMDLMYEGTIPDGQLLSISH